MGQIKSEDTNSNYLGIIKPGIIFIRYLYTNSFMNLELINLLQEEDKYKYNINIEKIRKVENKDIFSISFDSFLKNTITNYYILTLSEQDNDIINECQFLYYLYNYNNNNQIYSTNLNNRILTDKINYNNYISFKDEGTSDRISKEITFDSYGNYKVYILAEELENYSLFKLLGVKTYSYINEGNDNDINEDKKEKNEVSIILILLIVILSLLIIILSIFIIYHYKRKVNINQIISFINLSTNNSIKSNKNNILLNLISNKNENNNNLFFPILSNSKIELEEIQNNSLVNIQTNNKNNMDNKNLIINNIDDNEDIIDFDEEKSEPPPPPITALPPDNKISEMLNEIKTNKNNVNIYDKEKTYTNDGSNITNKGE